ncbi:peptide chain release factor 1 [Candidatus Dojkabacteria bacterium]|uniref:Peptide chain release factor 1 n=1 Tax=Candidatus Dojkabacteria bacterium TaxID=2099670 RepID=A0A955L5L5_9BACT|nr:peptide chain release factor 1 [Candidatus Dojkabacteria bacterium]
MLDKTTTIIEEYTSLSDKLSDPNVINNQEEFKRISVKHSKLTPIYEKAVEYGKLSQDITDAKELLEIEEDADMKEFYNSEINQNEEKLETLAEEITDLLNPANEDDDRNAIVEIRAGTGGDEAALFASDLYRMYLRYAEANGWKIETLSTNQTGNGGFKEIILQLSGDNAYGELKFESGVHRVQRVPATESSGRIHTSAVSVVVLPEVDDVEVDIKDEDLRIDVYRSSGPGGQSVNTTDSAVRITHIPTGIVVSCQDEKSQHKNKARALSVLKSRLYEMEREKQAEEESEMRQSSIKGGDRSAKIRTYNYPQSRVTDHRIKVSWHNLADILNGDLKTIIEETRKGIKDSNVT